MMSFAVMVSHKLISVSLSRSLWLAEK